MASHPKLLFFAGSSRAASHNRRLARLAATIAEANGIAATLMELGDYPMPLYNGDLEASDGPPDNARKLKALMMVHGGVFIAAPEYNACITPLLKNAIDWISHVPPDEGEEPQQVFKTRVFALASASPGVLGGLRGLNTVRQMLELGLKALVLPDQFAVPRAQDAFDDHGHLKDKGSQAYLKTLIQKLARAAHALHG